MIPLACSCPISSRYCTYSPLAIVGYEGNPAHRRIIMELMTVHVDSEGYTHIEVCLENEYLDETEMAEIYVNQPPIANLSEVVSIDKREADGFEFWHIKGV